MTFRTFLTVKRGLLGTLCIGALVLGATVAPVSASRDRARALHIGKECSQFQGNAGEWCTITRSNIRQVPAGSRVYYTQPAGIPAGLLDTNVVLDAGNGNRALGRCTVDLATNRGLCTFSDGTGRLAGFEARVDVSLVSGFDWRWDGAYSFDGDVD
jgi:hypothetical protein